MKTVDPPIVHFVDYNCKHGVRWSLEQLLSPMLTDSELDRELYLLLEYPTVYIIHHKSRANKKRNDLPSIAYVGETNSIENRTRQHRTSDLQSTHNEIWHTFFSDPQTRLYVIGHNHFNKSLTLDVENRLMSYVLASDTDASLGIMNGRGNPQNDYYTHDEFEAITSKAWQKLHQFDQNLFPPERVIKSKAIFKASPFHKLSDEQLQAEELIINQLKTALESSSSQKQLIVVEGAAGTGKTVLISHLFVEIAKVLSNGQLSREREEAQDEEHLLSEDVAKTMAIVVNHDEQKTVYDSIAKRLGLQKRNGEVVFQSTPFINKFSVRSEQHRSTHGLEHQLHPSKELDVVLVDEAHLLLNQANQSYVGHKNQLWDIIDRAKVVIAVYDLEQVLRKQQELPIEMKSVLFQNNENSSRFTRTIQLFGMRLDVANIELKHQMRVDACDAVVEWIDDFASGRKLELIPEDTKERKGADDRPYEIKVFDSPIELYAAIMQKAADSQHGLSRLLATYDWPYVRGRQPNNNKDEYWAVSLQKDGDNWVYTNDVARANEYLQLNMHAKRFSIPWNYQLKEEKRSRRSRDAAWAEKPYTIHEAGSIYTIQGFDLNFAGVIIGPSVRWKDGRIVFDASKSNNYQAINGSAQPEVNLRHELNVLLKRGVHGLYLFAVDQNLQKRLLKCANQQKSDSM